MKLWGNLIAMFKSHNFYRNQVKPMKMVERGTAAKLLKNCTRLSLPVYQLPTCFTCTFTFKLWPMTMEGEHSHKSVLKSTKSRDEYLELGHLGPHMGYCWVRLGPRDTPGSQRKRTVLVLEPKNGSTCLMCLCSNSDEVVFKCAKRGVTWSERNLNQIGSIRLW